jgi:hypothetical protein
MAERRRKSWLTRLFCRHRRTLNERQPARPGKIPKVMRVCQNCGQVRRPRKHDYRGVTIQSKGD